MIWTGFGFLVVVIGFGIPIVLQSLTSSLYEIPQSVVLCIGYLISAAVIWVVGNKLNTGKARILVDKQSGKEVSFKRQHTFFFIPFQYCAVGFILAAAYVLISGGN